MKSIFYFLALFISIQLSAQNYAIVIHGGAGSVVPERINSELQPLYEAKMKEALKAGEAVLKDGGTAQDAVVAAITVMEESPLFNAGLGAVMTYDTICELDASIMNGADLNAGAVAGVNNIKSPIAAAQAVMNNSVHVMLSGNGAEEFARSQKLDMVEDGYFETEKSREALINHLQRTGYYEGENTLEDWKYGTVGCVALDKNGNLAAGTSTGGMTGKRYGRIGDSPIIGAGTYADNASCGVSSTGHGEYFIRYNVAYDIAALMKYKKLTVDEAAREVIHKKLLPAGGRGGVIAMDNKGNISMPFNTEGMFRGYLKEGEEPLILMFGE